MNEPVTVICDDYSVAWARVIKKLENHNWNIWNLIVTIKNPIIRNIDAYNQITEFCNSKGILTPKKVQHTIFPTQIYKKAKDREHLYKYYWKFFNISRKMPHSGWGTYFQRMISYDTNGVKIDQLGDIIDSINNRSKNYGASFVMVIPYPSKDHKKKMGAPCLNYITVQVEKDSYAQNGRKISMLAVYRNHDFRERAYGNYLGLCDLLNYICSETNSSIGYLTCISSHAYASSNHKELSHIADLIIGENNATL